MTSMAIHQFQSYIDICENYRNQPNYYFFIKNYAFNKMFSYLSNDPYVLNEKEKSYFDSMLAEYKNEMANNPRPPNPISKEEYTNFLENFFNGVEFDKANLRTIEVCKDLTEVLVVFGDLEDLMKKRSKIIYLIFLSGLFYEEN